VFMLEARQVHATILFVTHHLLGNIKQYVIGYEAQQHEHRKVFV